MNLSEQEALHKFSFSFSFSGIQQSKWAADNFNDPTTRDVQSSDNRLDLSVSRTISKKEHTGDVLRTNAMWEACVL